MNEEKKPKKEWYDPSFLLEDKPCDLKKQKK
jgi:hypothetical protein